MPLLIIELDIRGEIIKGGVFLGEKYSKDTRQEQNSVQVELKRRRRRLMNIQDYLEHVLCHSNLNRKIRGNPVFVLLFVLFFVKRGFLHYRIIPGKVNGEEQGEESHIRTSLLIRIIDCRKRLWEEVGGVVSE